MEKKIKTEIPNINSLNVFIKFLIKYLTIY